MAESSEPNKLRFADFELDERTGELRSFDREPSAPPLRLAPQPTRLLAYLVRRSPELVGKEEIQALLWPDVAVDVEQSLHVCIRQIRQALGDSATAPRYVETIPRRGYRFIGGVIDRYPSPAPVSKETRAERCVDAEAQGPTDRRLRSNRPRRIRWSLGLLLLGPTLILGGLGWTLTSRSDSSPRRVAIMPLRTTGMPAAPAEAEGLAERIVRHLGNDPEAVELLGPTTTAEYDGAAPRLDALIDERSVDFIVNGRPVREQTRLLIEIIRARDGAHVWVRFLEELPPGRRAETIAQALLDHLDGKHSNPRGLDKDLGSGQN